MRSEKELLQVLLDNMDYFQTGLCRVITHLYLVDQIKYNELYLVRKYIRKNAPEMYDESGCLSVFNWVKGEKQPRIDWLNEQIQKLQQNEKT